jgi:SAM-dependent MidA family methyltransferase
MLHADHLELSDPTQALPAVHDDELVEGGTGPRWTSLGELPAVAVRGVVLANELLDNLPFRLLERAAPGWQEVRLGSSDDGLHEVLVPAGPADAALAQRLAPEAGVGARLPVQAAAAAWLQGALGLLEAGRVLVLDYADRSASLAARPWSDWVRTYRDHEPGTGPFEDLGAQDVTCEVATDQLARVRRPDLDRTQADLLEAHGIHDLVEQGRRHWVERAHIGDLEALAARSRIREAEALVDPHGLGGFRALEWVVDG